MKLDIDDLRDIIGMVRIRIADEELAPEEVADQIEREIDTLEKESF